MFENLTAMELSHMVHQKKAKPSEICDYFLSQSEKLNPSLNAFITLNEEIAMRQAKALDNEPITPETSALFGIPIAIKDNICTSDMPTTCASNMLRNFRPPYDATAVSRLRKQGAVIMGKTNMDEFAMGSSSETSVFGAVLNPHDLSRSPGGSSGGSAAAVAGGCVPLSLCSDTGGSIRQPASFCGLVGYKPSYGTVSRFGLIAYAGSFDQMGPISRTVSDAALMMKAISGYDKSDATSRPDFSLDFSQIENFNVKGKRIGIIKECYTEGLQDDVRVATLAAAATLKSLGAAIIDISIPSLSDSLSAYYALALAEAASNLSRIDGIRYGYRSEKPVDIDNLYIQSRTEGFGEEVKNRILIGTYLLSAGNYERYYKKARLLKAKLNNDFINAFTQCDIMLSPVTPKTAYKIGEKETDAAVHYLGDICTVPVNMAGLPAISVPCGKDKTNLPIGVQLIGKRFEDADLLGIARVLEQEITSREEAI